MDHADFVAVSGRLSAPAKGVCIGKKSEKPGTLPDHIGRITKIGYSSYPKFLSAGELSDKEGRWEYIWKIQ